MENYKNELDLSKISETEAQKKITSLEKQDLINT